MLSPLWARNLKYKEFIDSYFVYRLTGAYVQIIFRILLQDILHFEVVGLAFFLSFSGTFYFALRSEYHPYTPSFTNDSEIANISIPGNVASHRNSGDYLFETGSVLSMSST